MPTQLQIRRGSTTDHNSFTGAAGELTVDTTKDTLRVHDGSTAGGFELARADGSNLNNITSNITVNGTVTADGLDASTGDITTTSIGFNGSRTTTPDGLSYPIIWRSAGTHPDFNSGDLVIQARSDADRDIHFVTGNTPTERMRINSSGNVGIGTANPSAELHIYNDTSNADIRAQGGGATDYISLFHGASMNGLWSVSSTDPTVFATNNTEAMRINSGGTVLVGKTSSTSSTVGAELRQNGLIIATTSSVPSLTLNRTTSDGTIADFRKDNSTVGTISAASTNIIYGNDTRGLKIEDTLIIPRDIDDTTADTLMDLGSATSRFKDLYLSGGAYLGGSAAANKLDDYEEGTFTPVFEPTTGSFTTMTMDVVEAKYTKIGNAVTISVWVRTDNVDTTGASGALRLAGLPFNSNSYSSMAIGNSAAWGGDQPAYAFTSGAGNDYITLQYKTAINAEPNNVATTDLQTGAVANQNQMFISGTYFTTA